MIYQEEEQTGPESPQGYEKVSAQLTEVRDLLIEIRDNNAQNLIRLQAVEADVATLKLARGNFALLFALIAMAEGAVAIILALRGR